MVSTSPLDLFPSPVAMIPDNRSGPRKKLGIRLNRLLSKTNLSRTRGTPRKCSIGAGILSVSNSIVALSSPQLPSLPVHSRDPTASAIAYRTTSDAAQACLPPVQALASALPGVGGTIKGVIGIILSTIQFLDARMQNNEDLKRLRRLLYRIRDQIDIAPPATTPTEENSRWELLRALETAKSELEAMERRIRASPTLTQDITGCINRIHNHLSRYTAFAIMNLQNDVAEVKNRMEEIVQLHAGHIRAFEDFRATFGKGQLSILSRGHAILVDATGREHPMFLEQCQNFGQLDAMLPVMLFQCRPDEAEIQRWYIERKQYEFVIDDGRNAMELTKESDLWLKLEPGTKIIMRVIIEEDSTLTATYKCRCGTLNSIDVSVEDLMAALQCGCTITCRHCERRFQITRTLKLVDGANNQQEAVSDTAPSAADEHLIRNFVVRQWIKEGMHSLLSPFLPSYTGRLGCKWMTGSILCGLTFDTFDDLMLHMGSVHDVAGPASRRLVCRWANCSKERRRDGYRRHIGTHVRIVAPCPYCAKWFSRSDSMRAHVKKYHSSAVER